MNTKNDSYNEESEIADLEQFKCTLEEICQKIHDPRALDNQKHSLFTLLSIIFCAIIGGAKGKQEIAGWDDEYMAYLLSLAAVNKF